jgi:hypothetical protein
MFQPLEYGLKILSDNPSGIPQMREPTPRAGGPDVKWGGDELGAGRITLIGGAPTSIHPNVLPEDLLRVAPQNRQTNASNFLAANASY